METFIVLASHGPEHWILNMMQTRLSMKHPEDCPLILGFRRHLEGSYTKAIIKQRVSTVALFLHFMDPQDVSVKFIYNTAKMVEFFQRLDVVSAISTARSYLISIRTFMKYIASEDTYLKEDPSLPQAVEHFFKVMADIGHGVNKKDIQIKREKENWACTPEGCQRILVTVKPYFLNLINKAISGSELEDKDKMAVLRYLVSLLLLQHLQRPCVVQNITVQQWLLRSHLTVQVGEDAVEVAVIRVQQRMADMVQTSTIALENTEEIWFDIYFKKIRPDFIKNTNKRADRFFVSNKGEKLANVSVGLMRFLQRFKLPQVTADQAKKMFERICLPRCNNEDRRLLHKYLRRSDRETAENSDPDLVRAAVMVARMQKHFIPSFSRDADLLGTRGEGADNGDDVALMEEKEMCFKMLEREFPVGVNRVGPRLVASRKISIAHAQYLCDRWKRHQYKMRLDDVIGRFKRNPPTEEQIRSYIKVQGWKRNVPRVQDVLECWKPSVDRGKVDHTKEIERLVDSQDWKGLAIVEDRLGNTGETIITTLPFKKGDVVCDCHGPVVSHERGEEILNSIASGEMCYLYFFKDTKTRRRLCIDAQNFPCPCHPGLSTYGRKINHSKKKPNLKPEVKYLKDGTSPVILLIAKEDIDAGTELTFDYGVTMHIQQKHMAHQQETLRCGVESSQPIHLITHGQEMEQDPQENVRSSHVVHDQEVERVSHVPHGQEREQVPQESAQVSHVLHDQEVPHEEEMEQVPQENVQVSHVLREQEVEQVSHVPKEQEIEQASHVLHDQKMERVSHVPHEQVPREIEQVSHVLHDRVMEQVSQENVRVSYVLHEQEVEQVSHVPIEQEMEQVSHASREQPVASTSVVSWEEAICDLHEDHDAEVPEPAAPAQEATQREEDEDSSTTSEGIGSVPLEDDGAHSEQSGPSCTMLQSESGESEDDGAHSEQSGPSWTELQSESGGSEDDGAHSEQSGPSCTELQSESGESEDDGAHSEQSGPSCTELQSESGGSEDDGAHSEQSGPSCTVLQAESGGSEDDGAHSEQSGPSCTVLQAESGGSGPVESEAEEDDGEFPGPSLAKLQVGSGESTGGPTFTPQMEAETEDKTSLEAADLSCCASAPLPHSPHAGSEGSITPVESEPMEAEEDDSEEPGPSWAELQVGSEGSRDPTFTLQMEPESEDETSLEEEAVDLSCCASAPLPHSPHAGSEGSSVPVETEAMEAEEDDRADRQEPGPSWAEPERFRRDPTFTPQMEADSEDESSLEEEALDLSCYASAPTPHRPHAGAEGSRSPVRSALVEDEEDDRAECQWPGPSWAELHPGSEGSGCPTFTLQMEPESEDETSVEEEAMDLSWSASAPVPRSPQPGSGGFRSPTFTSQPESEDETSLEEPLDLSCSAPAPHSPNPRSPPFFIDVPTPTTGACSMGPINEDCPPSASDSPPPPVLYGDHPLWLLFEVQRQQMLLQRRFQRAQNLQMRQQRRHHLATQRRQQRLERHLLTLSQKLQGMRRKLRQATKGAGPLQNDPGTSPQRVEGTRGPRPARTMRERGRPRGAKGTL